MREFPRRELTRIGAPLAFLIAATILVLLVHSALSSGDGSTTKAATTKAATTKPATTRKTTTQRTTTRETTPAKPKKFYVIVAGDTFGSIAAREGTTVERLIVLNPGVDSSALSIGQKIRVG